MPHSLISKLTVVSKLTVGKAVLVALLLSFSASYSSQSFAGTFSWGDLSDPAGDLMYLGVTENNAYATTLFSPEPGVGSPSVIGNSLHFDPQGFQASASGGGTETTVSTLSTVLMARPGKTLNNIMVSEHGDATLSGLPGGMASASVGATFTWTILEVDNAPVSLPAQIDLLQVTTGAGLNGGLYSRSGDDGTAFPWTGSVLLDFDAYLNANSITGSATKVSVEFENELQTTADAVSNAFIKKKEIGGFAITANQLPGVPEPTTLVIALLGFTAMVPVRRRVG